MKKMIVMMAMMLTGLISFANTKEEGRASKSSSQLEKQFECTVSLKGYVTVGAVGFEVTCSATASTCEQATQQASTCLSAAVKTIRKIVL